MSKFSRMFSKNIGLHTILYSLLFQPSKVMDEIRDWVQTIIYVSVFYFACTTFVVEHYKIPSGSMIPTFRAGDHVVALKGLSLFTEFKRGEIIIFISAEDHKTYIVKRLVGLPGEEIRIRAPHVFINNELLKEPSLFLNIDYIFPEMARFASPYIPYKIPKNNFFVLGDNSMNSNDSRYWGPLPKEKVIGKALMIAWPLNRVRIFK